MAKREFTRWTDSTVAAFAPKPTAYKKYEGDVDLPGFGVRIAPGGTRTYILKYTRQDGSKPDYKLGTADELTLRQARKMARQVRDYIEDGADPQKDHLAAKAAKVKKRRVKPKVSVDGIRPETVDELFSWYFTKLKGEGASILPVSRCSYNLNIQPVIGSKVPSSVTRKDCMAVISGVVDRGAYTSAKNVKKLLSAAFNFALNAETDPAWSQRVPDYQLEYNPAASIRMESIDKLRLVRRQQQEADGIVPQGKRALSEVEIATLWQRLDDPMEISLDMGLAIKLLLATGQRTTEVWHAPWDEFDLLKSEWIIRGSRRKTRRKTESDHLVPLTPFHVELLQEIKALNPDSKYLFPGMDGQPRSYRILSQAVRRFCDPGEKSTRKPFKRFSPRDCRRTVKTQMASIKISKEIRDRIQGHAQTGLEAGYNIHDYRDEKVEAMGQWCEWLESVVNRPVAEVVTL